MLNISQMVGMELEYWEQERTQAVERYNQAIMALVALTQLTERMKQAVENEHQVDTFEGVEREAKTV